VSTRQSPSIVCAIVRFVGMVVGLGLFGGILGFIAAAIGAFLLKGELAGFGALAGGIAGFIIGYAVGVIVGLVLMNKLLHFRGSLLFGILGAAAGSALVAAFLGQLHVNPNLFFSLFFIAAPLFGTAGYHLKRH
jgi:hypothetical protein